MVLLIGADFCKILSHFFEKIALFMSDIRGVGKNFVRYLKQEIVINILLLFELMHRRSIYKNDVHVELPDKFKRKSTKAPLWAKYPQKNK